MKLLALVVAFACVLAVAVGCGYGKTACAVIDIAQQNCVWLRYLEADGTTKEVQLTPEEARDFGRSIAAKRASEQRDGGAK